MRSQQPRLRLREMQRDPLEPECGLDAAAHRPENRIGRLRGRQARRHVEQLLEARTVERCPLGLLSRIDRDRSVLRERDENLDLIGSRPSSVEGLPDREDPEDPALRVLERDEQLVLWMPGLGVVARAQLRDVAVADVATPVEREAGDRARR